MPVRHTLRVIPVLLVAAVMLASCSPTPEPSPPSPEPTSPTFPAATSPPTTEPSSSTLVQTIGDGVANWFSGLSGPSARPLNCPGMAPDGIVIASNGNARGCLRRTPDGLHILMENLSSLPLTIQGAGIYSWTLPPGQKQDIRFSRLPKYRDYFTFKPQLESAVTAAVANYVVGKLVRTPPAVQWRPCFESLTTNCLVKAFVALLPSYVDIGRYHVPVKKIAGVLSQIWSYKPIYDAWQAQRAGTSIGRLTICDPDRRSC
jgi:hypothetical protein